MPVERPGFGVELQSAAKRLAAASWAGLIAGFLVGGIGGRLAMFVLRLTSDPSLRGAETDDGFIIGSFTTDTGFLILLTTAAGVIGGALYLLIRPFLPEDHRVAATALLAALLGAPAVIRPGGIDFTLLEPLTLAIGLFVIVPALQGAVTALAAERFLARAEASRSSNWILVIVMLLPIAATGIFGAALVAILFVGWAIARAYGTTLGLDRDRVVLAGRVVLIALGAWLLFVLQGDVRAIL